MYKLTPIAARVNQVLDSNPTYIVGHFEVGNDYLDGRTILVREHKCLHFGNASYLGLELDERLKQGAKDAIDAYGTQFSSSRSYAGLPLYSRLEAKFMRIFQRPVVLTPTTTLTHLAFLPLFVHANDVVLIDYLAHASLQVMVRLPKSEGTEIVPVKHNDMAGLAEKLEFYSKTKERVWYVADGIYSMFGDTVPTESLLILMDKYPNLYLYLDDAHGMAWHGKHGRGWVAEHFGNNDRVVIALSLAKAFGTGGGLLVLPNEEMRKQVKQAGGSMVFSGPMQPAQLGAGLVSADILLSEEFETRQAKLHKLIDTFITTARSLNLPLANESRTPIFFIEIGPMNVGFTTVEMMIKAGFYMNIGVFPAVQMNRTGLRISLSHHLEVEDIKNMLRVLAEILPQAYAKHNTSFLTVRKRFYERVKQGM
jgi:7-keto-8-aminopelargonate synthetase-like enzyme